MDLIREILAAHASGISRDGLLAWARLRGSPQMTDEELDAALAAMGDEVVDVQGFLYLRRFASGSASAAAPAPPPPPAPGWGSAADTPHPASWPPSAVAPPGSADAGIPAWSPPDGSIPPSPDQPTWTPAEQPSGGKRTMLVAAAGVGIFVAISLAVSFVLRVGEPDAPAVPTPTAGTVIGAESLAVGDCIVLPSEDTFDEVRKLACAESHDAEVFFVGDHPDGTFPSDEAFEAFVDERCLPAFAAYTGSDYYEQEVLEIGWFTPTEGAWDRGDREVVCHLVPADGSQTDRSWQGGNP